MIERRIKRVLWAVSILIALGFGGHSAYEFRKEVMWEDEFQEWVAKSKEHAKECEKLTKEVKAKAGSAAGWEIINARAFCESTAVNEGVSLSSRVKFKAADAAQQSLAIAIACPIALWTLFFLLRWIWTGKIRNPQSLAAETHQFFTKQILYCGLGILGCVLLFVVNVLVLPSGRAVQVLISTAVQGIGLVLVAWIVTKVREARRKRAEQERAAQPVAAVDPPHASGH